jgi:hypothetical protein
VGTPLHAHQCGIPGPSRNRANVHVYSENPFITEREKPASDPTGDSWSGQLVQRGDELSQTTLIHVVFTQAQFELL